jgi:hypothetical protein
VGWVGLALGILTLSALPALAVKDKTKKVDLIWSHPRIDSLGIRSMALLPASSFDHNRQNERLIENLFAQSLRPSGYRWVTPLVGREIIKSALGESTLAAIDRDVLKLGRVDSLRAGALCRALRTDAVLTTRVDLFEQVQVEWNQAGKPTTTVRLRAAVVDSAGRLVWSASGGETGEGTYHDPTSATMGVKSDGLGSTPITAQGGAPSFEEVTTRLLTRWMAFFPRLAATPAQP